MFYANNFICWYIRFICGQSIYLLVESLIDWGKQHSNVIGDPENAAYS